MITHDLVQGSDEWLAYRANHFNASDAPAMMGVSKYRTRTQLLHELHTGLTPDVNNSTQKLFNDGHKFEALARPLAEEIIGQELYPITASDGKLSASFDGITLDESIIFEHKTLNQNIANCVTVYDLDEMYLIQMEQQLFISNAKKCLFMASKWDSNDQLIQEVHFWYEPNDERCQKILDGWNQFADDLKDYAPMEVKEAPKAQAIMALPSLAIQIKGEVTLSNLAEFKTAATAFIESINTELVTDDDFANAEATAKFCKDAEDNIELTKKSAIAQTASIDELMRTMDYLKDQLRDKRLLIEKLVKSEKENRKLEIINKAKDAYQKHLEDLREGTHPLFIPNANPDFSGAIKSKKTLTSMQSAVNDLLARSKQESSAIDMEIRAKQVWMKSNAEGYEFLFIDLQIIIFKPIDDFKLLVQSRIDNHKKVEAEREAKIIAEANADVLEKVRLSELAKEQTDAKQETLGALDMSSGVGRLGTGVGYIDSVVTGSQNSVNIQHFQGVEPSASDLVKAVAKSFGADEMLAHKWLLEADFTKYQQAA
jgi:putative phage-type endonuclease